MLLIELNGLTRVAQSGVAISEIAEGGDFRLTVSGKPRGFGLRFEPTDALARVETESTGINRRVYRRDQRRGGLLVSSRLEPVERRLQMPPLAVEERQTGQDVLPAFQEQLVRPSRSEEHT